MGTTGRGARRASAALVGLGVAAAALAGCSAQVAPGAAAVDADGDVVMTVDRLEAVSAELQPAQLTPRQVLFYEIISDDVRDLARREGAVVSADEIQRRAAAGEPPLVLSDEAAEVFATAVMANTVAGGPAGQELLDRIAELDPAVNPRYGTWDASLLPGALPVTDETMPWLVTPADGAAPEPTG